MNVYARPTEHLGHAFFSATLNFRNFSLGYPDRQEPDYRARPLPVVQRRSTHRPACAESTDLSTLPAEAYGTLDPIRTDRVNRHPRQKRITGRTVRCRCSVERSYPSCPNRTHGGPMTACDGYDGTLTDSGRRRQDMRLNGNSAANRINMNRVYNGKLGSVTKTSISFQRCPR